MRARARARGVTPGQRMDNNLLLSPKGAEPGQMGEGGDGEVVQAGAAGGAEAEVRAEGSVGPIRSVWLCPRHD